MDSALDRLAFFLELVKKRRWNFIIPRVLHEKTVKNHFEKRHMSNVMMHSITSIQNTDFLVEAQHSKDRM